MKVESEVPGLSVFQVVTKSSEAAARTVAGPRQANNSDRHYKKSGKKAKKPKKI